MCVCLIAVVWMVTDSEEGKMNNPPLTSLKKLQVMMKFDMTLISIRSFLTTTTTTITSSLRLCVVFLKLHIIEAAYVNNSDNTLFL